MSQWVTGFVIPEVADVHLAFGSVIKTAELLSLRMAGTPQAVGADAILAELRRAYVTFDDGLRTAAIDGAASATQGIRQRLAATAVRSDTGQTPHLRDLITCRPLPVGTLSSGMVGVGLVSALNRAVNRLSPGYGSYWRAQEYGTGQGDVPSQTGRILFGYFAAAGGGDATPPQSQYAGGGGPHPVFFSTASGTLSGPNGGLGGLGTIGHEIRPRHFIEQGKDGAAVRWREQIGLVQQRALEQLSMIGAA